MKVIVDQEDCTGCGACIDICPEVFQWDDDKAVACKNSVPDRWQASCREAEDACPVDAITIEE